MVVKKRYTLPLVFVSSLEVLSARILDAALSTTYNEQVVKAIWHKTTSLPHMDGWIVFVRWRQCAFPCGHIGATWQIQLNLCFLWHTRVHNPNDKSIGLAVLAQLTAESPYSYNGLFWPPKLPLLMGASGPHLIHGSLGPPDSSTQTASRSLQPFVQGSLVTSVTEQYFKLKHTENAVNTTTSV